MQSCQFTQEIFIDSQRSINSRVFPKVISPCLISTAYQLQQYLIAKHVEIVSQVNKHGAILFRGFDIKNPCQLASVLNKIGLKSFEYIGGAAVRNLILGRAAQNYSRNVEIFTSNEAPPNQLIPFHNELLQTPNYPQYLGFYCFSQAETGGSTPIVHCHELYQYILQKYPKFITNLTELGVRYIRVVGKQDNPNSPIGRGWKNIFKVNTKQQAQKQMIKSQYQFKWLPNDDCQIISKRLEAIRNSKSGNKMFCNQMIAVFQGWIDNKNTPQNCLKFGNFQDIPFDIMKDICQYADTIKVSIPWKKGDFILIDNESVAHSRQPFTGSHRRIYAMLFKGQKIVEKQPYLTLNSGDQMPVIGFGTWKIQKEKCSEVVYNALKSGYKLLDCACDYGNEQYVGEGIKKAIDQKIIKREQLFVTSKLWNSFHKPQNVRIGFLKTLKDLGLQYLDLYLIHFPIATKFVPIEKRYPPQWIYDNSSVKPCMEEENVPIIQTWKVMQQLVKQGLIKNIGVCNFGVSILRDLINSASILPSVLQVQLHPYLTQKKLITFCRSKSIQMTSYSTFGASSYIQLSMAKQDQTIQHNQVIQEIAYTVKKSPYQVALRWAIQHGLAIIPKSSNLKRLQQNRDITSWRLTQEQMKKIDNLNKNRRFNDPGVFCELAFNTFFPIYQ